MTIESTLERIANALESLDEKIGCLIDERSGYENKGGEAAIESPAPVKHAAIIPEPTEAKKKRAVKQKVTEIVVPAVIPEVDAAAQTAPVKVAAHQVTLPVEGAPSFLPGVGDTEVTPHTIAEIRTKAIEFLTGSKNPVEESQRRVALSKVLSTCGVKSFDDIPPGKIEALYNELIRVVS